MRVNNKKGFTLLEVMVALAVVAIVSGPLLQTFVTSARVGQRSYDIDKANSVTVETIENIKGSTLEALTGDDSGFEEEEEDLYTRTEFYDSSWNGPFEVDPDGSYPFKVECVLSNEATSVAEQSYIARLGTQDGDTGYYVEAAYGQMTGGAQYTITVEQSGDGSYHVTSGPILRNSKTDPPGTVRVDVYIPAADCSGTIPIVVDVPADGDKDVTLKINNQTDSEVNLYIYGDTAGEHVSAGLSDETMGNMNVSRMSVSSETLDFNKLQLEVKVVRSGSANPLTNYTTMIYFAG